MGNTLLLGIGNPNRGDDAAGWAVVDQIKDHLPSHIACKKVQGDIAQILDLFTKFSTLYAVDACRMEAPAGAWKRIDTRMEPLPSGNKPTSTHGFTLVEAVALAKNLGSLPEKLIVYAIIGNDFSMKATLSPEVAHAAKEVSIHLLNELQTNKKKRIQKEQEDA